MPRNADGCGIIIQLQEAAAAGTAAGWAAVCAAPHAAAVMIRLPPNWSASRSFSTTSCPPLASALWRSWEAAAHKVLGATSCTRQLTGGRGGSASPQASAPTSRPPASNGWRIAASTRVAWSSSIPVARRGPGKFWRRTGGATRSGAPPTPTSSGTCCARLWHGYRLPTAPLAHFTSGFTRKRTLCSISSACGRPPMPAAVRPGLGEA